LVLSLSRFPKICLGKKIKVNQVSIEILGKIFLYFSIFGENGQNFRIGSNSKINGRS
jgi:hypothetical protein